VTHFVSQWLNFALISAEGLPQSSTFLYFSMGTLSGVGTGVIAPINPYIRLIIGIENMIGIFYLAVVVSRLVSSYRPRNRQQRHQPADQPIE
jgi:ABC-type proline/glycine betaine transport system permease subunit